MRRITVKTASGETHVTFSKSAKRAPFITRLLNDLALSARLQTLLPANTSLADAAQGFSSEGQFIAALHASKDLGISFAELKKEITRTDPVGVEW